MFNYYFSILIKCKVEILAGIFWGLAVYSYFYRKVKVKNEIVRLKKEVIAMVFRFFAGVSGMLVGIWLAQRMGLMVSVGEVIRLIEQLNMCKI